MISDESAARNVDLLLLSHFSTNPLTPSEAKARLHSVLCLSSQMDWQFISPRQVVKTIQLLELHDEFENKFVAWTRIPSSAKARPRALLQYTTGLHTSTSTESRLLKQTLIRCALKADGHVMETSPSVMDTKDLVDNRSSLKSIFHGNNIFKTCEDNPILNFVIFK